MAVKNFFQELKRRNIFRVVSIYAVTSWLVIQIVAAVFPIFNFPNWSQQLIVTLLIIGFPLAVIFGWLQGHQTEEQGKKRSYWILPTAALGLGLIALLIWRWSGASAKENLLSESIRDEKVAVNVFENKTGDESLVALGFLASEWISSSLRELKVRTVSPEMVRKNKDLIGILPNNPDEKVSFAEVTGAKYIVGGSYYLEGDTIIFNTRLSSSESGEDIKNFPILKNHKDNKELLIEELKQYLLGYWVLKQDQLLPKINPPKLEAYQAYLDCFWTDIDCFQSVLEIDPDFLLAKVHLAYPQALLEKDSAFEANSAYIKNHWNQCTRYEQNIFRFAEAISIGDYEKAFVALDENFQADEKDYLMMHESSYILSDALNRPATAAARYGQFFDAAEVYESRLENASFMEYTHALNRIGAFEKTVDLLTNIKPKIRAKDFDGWPVRNLLVALMRLNRLEEAKLLLAEQGDRYALWAAYAFATIHPEADLNPFETPLRAWLKNSSAATDVNLWIIYQNFWDFSSPVMAHFVLGDWSKTEAMLLKMRSKEWDAPSNEFESSSDYLKILWLEAMLGSTYAHQGKRGAASQQLEIMEKIGLRRQKPHTNPFIWGATPYLMARIHAVLGEKEKAFELLQTARDQGRLFIWGNFSFDLDLANLKGYPPFEALIHPKEDISN
ncbi:MAG: hypothetical protein HRU41_03590 [Saprospiraceae bacterium]|nr:hypothetical protein [Saprospiraceae bacterium]